ncbi:MAG: MoxR family ATPase [Victivallaceae bacterium]|nr:MoxR family ATPase [Victivallaceae bacterium]
MENPESVIAAIAPKFARLKQEIGKRIFGQEQLIDGLLLALLCRSHCILTGVPGLAKTLLIKTLAEAAELDFKRVQFTPDMMPADLIGSQILETAPDGRRTFRFVPGPVFAQLLLADEINRTPPKTQSALLEAMEEHQISADGRVYPLPEPFFVLATQNPIEQEGTYRLPEAQQDRFMFSLYIDYPDEISERRVMLETTGNGDATPQKVVSAAELVEFQHAVREIPVPESVADYTLNLVRSTRPGEDAAHEINDFVRFGAGPRACQFLILAGKARAALAGRFNVSCEDIRFAAYPVLRHRLLLNFRARSEGITPDRLIEFLLENAE